MTGDQDKGPSDSHQDESLLHEPDASEAMGVSSIRDQVTGHLTGSGRFRDMHNRARQEAMKDPLFRQAEEDARALSKELADKKRAREAERKLRQALDDAERPHTLSRERQKEVIRILREEGLKQRQQESTE